MSVVFRFTCQACHRHCRGAAENATVICAPTMIARLWCHRCREVTHMAIKDWAALAAMDDGAYLLTPDHIDV